MLAGYKMFRKFVGTTINLMSKPLTIKQEKFCQAYILLGDKTAAYKEAYAYSNMKPESINRKAFEVFENVNVAARIQFLQAGIKKRNEVTIDEIISVLGNMLRFDIGELYNEDGSLKPIHSIPKEARLMISQLDTDEIFAGRGEDREMIGLSRRVRTYSKNDAIEKLMKHLGGYAKDNEQSKPEVNVNTSAIDITKLSPEALRELRDASKPLQ